MVVDFDQHVHAMRDRRVLDILGCGIVERRHDEQDAVGAIGAGLDHLIGVEDEVLAQHRQVGRRARRVRKSSSPWNDGVSVSTDRHAAPPAS